jgi:hypothetical protein
MYLPLRLAEMIDMQLIQFLSALLTPVIALVTTYIAVQQYRTSRLKFKLEIFEKRYAIYQGVKNFIHIAVQEGTLTNEAFFKLNEETQDAFFLFDERVDKYVDELRSKGARLRYLNERLSDQSLAIGEERSRLAEEDAELNTWFGKQLLQSKQVFKKDLRVR